MNSKLLLAMLAVLLAFQTAAAQTRVTLTFQDASSQEIEVSAAGKIYFDNNYMYIDDGTAVPYSFAVSDIRKMTFDEVLCVREIVTESFKVYPNPARNELYVNGDESGPYLYALYAMDGRMLLQGKVQNGDAIQIGNIPTGLYILKINNTSLKINKL